MECLVAILVATLDARPHLLVADIALQLPSRPRDLLHLHNRLHEGMIAKRHFRYPHCAEQMSPSRGISLLKGPIGIGAENAGL